MISVIHMDHARISAISNFWHARYPAQWRRMLAVANLLDVPLLSLIYARLRELQDGAAREAFTRQEDFSVITWEWREAIVSERLPHKLHNLHSRIRNDRAHLGD
jgi:hypothetical protein